MPYLIGGTSKSGKSIAAGDQGIEYLKASDAFSSS